MKPAYRVPLVAEVPALMQGAPVVASAFAGCGGSCFGYELAGYRVAWASEWDENARECHTLNFPECIHDARDVREVQAEDILTALGLRIGDLDVFDGSPPCQTFSTAGKRKMDDSRSNLFIEYARLLKGLQPRAFVAENVSGMAKGKAVGWFKEILAVLKSCGYRVQCRLLDAQWLGVPQSRQRLIFIGIREDLGKEPMYPRPLPYRYSVAEACPWITRATDQCGGFNGPEDATNRPSRTLTSQTKLVAEMVVGNDAYKPKWGGLEQPSPAIMSGGAHGGNGEVRFIGGRAEGKKTSLNDPSPSVQAVGLGGSGHGQYEVKVLHGHGGIMTGAAARDEADAPSRTIRTTDQSQHAVEIVIDPDSKAKGWLTGKKIEQDAPMPTVTADGLNAGHAPKVCQGIERRKFTIAELKRICGFPDDFKLVGAYAKQWARLGNVVPPPMMFHVARILRDEVLDMPGGGFRFDPQEGWVLQ